MRWGVSFSPEEGVAAAREEEDEVQQVVIFGCPQQVLLLRQPWLAQAKRIRRMRIKRRHRCHPRTSRSARITRCAGSTPRVVLAKI